MYNYLNNYIPFLPIGRHIFWILLKSGKRQPVTFQQGFRANPGNMYISQQEEENRTRSLQKPLANSKRFLVLNG
jgi:hypothetical protein